MESADHAVDAGSVRARAGTRILFVGFAILTLLAAGQLLLLGERTERYFAWTITSRPMAGFLGAAYAAGFVLSLLSLLQRRWQRVRIVVIAVAAFTMLALGPTVIHMHKLHLMMGESTARFAAWLWLVAYSVTPLACIAVLIAQQLGKRAAGRPRKPMPFWLVALIGSQGLIMIVAGGTLFVTTVQVHELSPDAIPFWPWSITPLTGGIVGSWLIAFGVAALTAIWQRDLADLVVPAAGYVAFGLLELLILFFYRADIRPGSNWLWVYLIVLVTIVGVGAYGLWAGSRALRSERAVQIEPS
jgi:hypothetical protein